MRKSDVDYSGFENLTNEVDNFRKGRIVDVIEFKRMAKEPGTILLDTRSKSAYEARHIKGAVHLNFSDFTEEKLAKVIPSKNTRVLIYCNNNFSGDPVFMASKMPPLALNIPTFINLYGYGYKNIYELGSMLDVSETDRAKGVEFAGTAIR